MRAVARLPDVPEVVRAAFFRVWIHDGDSLRGETDDDRTLTKALRALLPPYIGGPLTLYRGDSLYNRQRRTYGLSWSADLDVADGYATPP